MLLVYWSLIILAPVLSQEFKNNEKQVVIRPLQKPNM